MPEWSEAAVCDGIGHGELVAAEEIDVTPGYRRESSYIGGQRRRPSLAELAQGFLHVDSVPIDDGIEGEAEDPKLLLLPLTQRASDFTPIAVMDAPTELVAQFLPVELKQDPPTERSVVDADA